VSREPTGEEAVTAPVPFTVEFTPAAIADLRDRLARTRWPERETVTDWSQGVPLAYLREVCDHWSRRYDFDAAQRRLNAFPQYRAEIDGLGIHFLHVRSPHEGALPLVLTHGWPGSFVEFLGVIDALADPLDPTDAFDVVVPSLPGYGYSDRPDAPGWDLRRVARAWDGLMRTLGYDRYGAQGGDWGAILTTSMARQFADHLVGIHVNMPVLTPAAVDASEPTAEEQAALARVTEHRRTGRGYAEQQSTRPQTLGYGLTDSPVGQCAWILEKCALWTDCDGDPERALTRDQMLDNISVYWFTATAASSARLYWESLAAADLDPVAVPAGVSVFPKELFPASRRWVEAHYHDLRHYGRLERGGHFAAWEQPDVFVDEVRAFFRTVR
jgi:pimeloyl-ACP methyl ester carboxylesterase